MTYNYTGTRFSIYYCMPKKQQLNNYEMQDIEQNVEQIEPNADRR